MKELENIQHKNVVVTISYDTSCECPLNWETDIIFATWERNSIFSSNKYRPFEEPEQAHDWAEANGYSILPLYKYQHGNVAYSCSPFSCQWDSGQVGYFLFKEGAFGEDPAKSVSDWLAMFSNWCNGNCYGYIIASAEDGAEIDSCWGFIGYDSVKEAYEEALPWCVAHETERQQKALRAEELQNGAWIETQV